MPKQADQPFHKVTMARARLDMAVQFPESVKPDDVLEFHKELQAAFNELMDFRNIVASMAGLKVPCKEAAAEFLDLTRSDDS